MSGWNLRCPFCWRLLLPSDDASLHYVLAPRLAHHMYAAHPYEATVLRLALIEPPAEWPVIEAESPPSAEVTEAESPPSAEVAA